MPFLSYFAVVGSALVGLLFVADAMLPDRGPLSISSEFHGVSATLHADPVGRSADIEPDLPGFAPAPDMKSAAIKLAREDAPQPKPIAAPKLEPVNAAVAKAEPTPKKRKRVVRSRASHDHVAVARRREWRNHYAQAEDFGWNWGSNNRSSWRNDSWHSDARRQDSWRHDSWRQDSSRNDSWQGNWGNGWR
jgi:hypothetical protein